MRIAPLRFVLPEQRLTATDHPSVIITIHPDLNLVFGTVVGVAYPKDFKDAFDRMINSSEFRVGMNSLWDLRRADVENITTLSASGILNHVEKYAEQRGCNFRLAMVAGNEMTFAICRTFELLSIARPCENMVYQDMDEALAWLGF